MKNFETRWREVFIEHLKLLDNLLLGLHRNVIKGYVVQNYLYMDSLIERVFCVLTNVLMFETLLRQLTKNVWQ